LTRAKYEMVAISAAVSENGELPEHLRRIWPDAGLPARPNLRFDINPASSIGAATIDLLRGTEAINKGRARCGPACAATRG
jgi:hypothetical protein